MPPRRRSASGTWPPGCGWRSSAEHVDHRAIHAPPTPTDHAPRDLTGKLPADSHFSLHPAPDAGRSTLRGCADNCRRRGRLMAITFRSLAAIVVVVSLNGISAAQTPSTGSTAGTGHVALDLPTDVPPDTSFLADCA